MFWPLIPVVHISLAADLKCQKGKRGWKKCKRFCLMQVLFLFLYEHCTYYTGSKNKHIPNLGCYTKQFEERDLRTRQLSITVVATNKIDFNERGHCKSWDHISMASPGCVTLVSVTSTMGLTSFERTAVVKWNNLSHHMVIGTAFNHKSFTCKFHFVRVTFEIKISYYSTCTALLPSKRKQKKHR